MGIVRLIISKERCQCLIDFRLCAEPLDGVIFFWIVYVRSLYSLNVRCFFLGIWRVVPVILLFIFLFFWRFKLLVKASDDVSMAGVGEHVDDDRESASKETQAAASSSSNESDSSAADPPPDGGYGWVCVASVFINNGFTWGVSAVRFSFKSILSSQYVQSLSTS